MNLAKIVKAVLTPLSVVVAALGGLYLVNKVAASLDLGSRIGVGLILGLVIGLVGCTAFGALILFGAREQTDNEPEICANLDAWLHGLTTLPLRWMVYKLGSSVLVICGILSFTDPKWHPASAFVAAMYLCVCLMLLHIAKMVTRQWREIMFPVLRPEEVLNTHPSEYQR